MVACKLSLSVYRACYSFTSGGAQGGTIIPKAKLVVVPAAGFEGRKGFARKNAESSEDISDATMRGAELKYPFKFVERVAGRRAWWPDPDQTDP